MMRRFLALVVALALAACGRQTDADRIATNAHGETVPAGVPGAPAGGWTAAVAATPDGGMRMGNPRAKAQLVEYGSYTCSHCAAFAADASDGIRRMVASGSLSYEMRPYVRDSFDMAAALVARCGGPGPFFALSDALFARQQEWLGNAANMMANDERKILAMPKAKQYPALAKSIGLTGFLGPGSVTPQRADQCLADGAAQDRLVAIRDEAARRYKIDSTPSFLLDGKSLGPFDWAGLQPQIAAAVGG